MRIPGLGRLRSACRRLAGVPAGQVEALLLPVGQITLEEARFLGQLAQTLTHDGPIVEIGSLFGWSTRVLLLFKDPSRPLIAVDAAAWNPLGLSPAEHERCLRAVLQEGIDKYGVSVVIEDKTRFYRSYAGPVPAMVFLDAIHEYRATMEDIEWAKSLGVQVICVHDFSDAHPEVVRAVNDCGGAERVCGSIAVLKQALRA